MRVERTIRWIALIAFVLALIIVPFLFFAEQIENWTVTFKQSAASHPLVTAAILFLLLASDILLPIPSSIVSTSAGYLLGFVGGTLASLAGMTFSCIAGYWVGLRFGRPVAERLVGEGELARMERINEKFGNWVIVVARAVPVLAEASVLFAGVGRMPASRFFMISTLSNLGVSMVYAAVGRLDDASFSFLFAFIGAIVIPGIAMLATGELGERRKEPVSDGRG